MSYLGNSPTEQSFVATVDYFNGDGSTVSFTLSRQVTSVAQVQAVIENVPQNPSSAFTVLGNVITFTSAPPAGTANIYVYYTSPNTKVIAPSSGTVGTDALAAGAVTAGKLANGAARENFGAGAVLQVKNYQTGTLATGTGAIPFDNTIPQITEGTEFMSLAFTPTSATSKLLIQVVWQGASPTMATNGFAVALFAAGTSNALACLFNSQINSSACTLPLNHFMTAGTTSPITFTVRAGAANGSTTSFNGQSGSQLGGGVIASSITITEIAA